MLTTWLVSVDLPAGGGERKPRPATLAIRRFRRPVEVCAPSTASPAPSGATGGAASADPAAQARESGQAKGTGGSPFRGIGPRESESGDGIGPSYRDPWAARLKRVRATLARARAIQDWIDCEPGRKAADVARREHLTRARVSQLLRLHKLAPEIWRDIEQPGRTGPVLGELELRGLTSLPPKDQVKRYRALLGLDAPAPGDEPPRTAAKSARNRGLAAHLARARELQALIESGRFATIADLGRHIGMSGARVSQLLGLLDLAPEIIAAIDVPEEQAPKVKERELRRIARLPVSKQMKEWRRLLGSAGAKPA